MADAAQPGGGSKLVWILVVGLLGAVWWLASERNARKFSYEVRGGELIVAKGRYFPTSTAAIGPGDALGKVYAGIAPPAGTKPILETEFDDQQALDRALYDLVTGWARGAAQKKDSAGQQQAEELVARLSALSGLTPAQLGDLQGLHAELGWWSAGRDLDAAVKQLAVARRKLEEVRRGDADHAAQATAMLAPLDALALQLTELAAGRGGSAPAAQPAPGNTLPALASPAAASAPAVAPAAAGAPVTPPAVAVPAPAASATPSPAPHAAAPAVVPAAPLAPAAEPKAAGSTERPKGRASAPTSVSSGAPK